MDLFERLKNAKAIPPFLEKKGHFVVDDSMGVSLLIASAFKQSNEQYLIIVPNLYQAQKIYSLLSSFVDSKDVFLFPSDELIRAENMVQSKEMVAQRLYAMSKIVEGQAKIIIANVASATRYLPQPQLFKEHIINLEVGRSYDLVSLKKSLVKNGYSLVNKIDQSLQCAVRGDILDIFSVNNDLPVRIEFYGDEIESIRYFDIATQTSTEKIQKTIILPASDIILSDQELLKGPDKLFDILQSDEKHLIRGDFEQLRDNLTEDIDRILSCEFNQRVYKYYGQLLDRPYSLFDYCGKFTKIFANKESIIQSNELLLNESNNYLMELFENRQAISHLSFYQDIQRLTLFSGSNIITTSEFYNQPSDNSFALRNVPFQASKSADAISIIQSYINEDFKVILSLSKNEHINAIQEGLSQLGLRYEMVHDFDLPTQGIGITTFYLPQGFVLPDEKIVYLTSTELFNDRVKTARFDNRFREATILKSYEDLEPGDYVVHEYQGIGQFVALINLEVDGIHRDYLKLAYHGGELLYVPLSQFQLVRKYLGKEGSAPRLSRLHSKDWENTKKKIKQRINDLAERLMNLYIERSKIKGYSFAQDDEFQEQFERSFPYELTPDQETAMQDIKKDMESSTPMDRLLCGDVGYGKTELAFRAAFKAINSGKQVALLCPTTLLARQHYELAMERFSKFDVKIAVFSRLIPEKKQQEYLQGLKDGTIHFAIGTHRLLSKEILFQNLGLLVIDEEQRFGVEQKERLKEIKSNVDVLTLTATPIPRTLQISLLGVRPMSIINTAPQSRMPIQTYVAPFNIDIAKELIQRELGRKGQVFYLHNNISTLYMCANRLHRLMPEISIGVIHGSMDKEDIEETMMKFYNGEINILVCTSIIENGIDIPNANMIIVEDSENYGLAQLYQIKGRVGRSDRIAYAYLMYSPHKILKEKAQKRLKAIQDFTELGSGYKIAQRDLMIRGSGDVLGPEQAGFIDSIGLDMYIKLLNEAVKEKMTGEKTEEVEVAPTLTIDAFIPDSFANDSDKIELYQEILSSPSIESLASTKIRTRDIFGKIPPEVELLFSKRNIDLLVKEARIELISEKPKGIELLLGDEYLRIRGIGNLLFQSIIPFLQVVKISYLNNKFKIYLDKRANWISDLESILKSLVKVLINNKIIEEV